MESLIKKMSFNLNIKSIGEGLALKKKKVWTLVPCKRIAEGSASTFGTSMNHK